MQNHQQQQTRRRGKRGGGCLLQMGGDKWRFQLRQKGLKGGVQTFKAKSRTRAEAIAADLKRAWERQIDVLCREAQSVTTQCTLDSLLTAYMTHLNEKRRKSRGIIEIVIKANLWPYFTGKRADEITTEALRIYREHRRSQVTNKGTPVSDSTVNRELSYLRAAYYVGKEKVSPPLYAGEIPYFPLVSEAENVRTGCMTLRGYRALLNALPWSLKLLFSLAFHTGGRLGELLSIEPEQLDRVNRRIILRPEQTKNGLGRTIPLYGDLTRVADEHMAKLIAEHENAERLFVWFREDVGLRHGGVRVDPGNSMRSFGGTWRKATTAVGVPKLLFHDLRRTACTMLVQEAGLDEKSAMEISGHLTPSIFRRYNIHSQESHKRSLAKLDSFTSSEPYSGSQGVKLVVGFKTNKTV